MTINTTANLFQSTPTRPASKLFIVSKQAGGGRAQCCLDIITSCYEAAGKRSEIELRLTESADDIKLLSKDFIRRHREYPKSPTSAQEDLPNIAYTQDPIGKPSIYVAGGDGSFSELCNCLALEDAPPIAGFIPAGTANDLAKSFGYYMPRSTSGRIKLIQHCVQESLNPKLRRLDLIEYQVDGSSNKRYSCNILSFGIDSAILKESYRFLQYIPSLPSLAFGLAILKHIKKPQHFPVNYKLTDCKGQIQAGFFSSCFGLIANGKYYGNGRKPAPAARIDDGLVEVQLGGGDMRGLQFAHLAHQLKQGKHLNSHLVQSYQAIQSGSIITDEPIVANADGELFSFRNLNFRVLKHKLWATW